MLSNCKFKLLGEALKGNIYISQAAMYSYYVGLMARCLRNVPVQLKTGPLCAYKSNEINLCVIVTNSLSAVTTTFVVKKEQSINHHFNGLVYTL
jgi:hypothetical protein